MSKHAPLYTPGLTSVPDPLTLSALNTDAISEKTAAAGVTIDSVLLKDNAVTANTFTANTSVSTDTISEKTSAAGVTVDGVLLKDSAVSTDTINEKTAAAGVTIDSVLLKDNAVTANTDTAFNTVQTNYIHERIFGSGVTIDGVLLKDIGVTADTVATDTISEKTPAAGVTIDGLLIKDGAIPSIPPYSPSYWSGTSNTFSVPNNLKTLNSGLTVTASSGPDISLTSGNTLTINTTGVYTVSIDMVSQSNSTGDRQFRITNSAASAIYGGVYTKASATDTTALTVCIARRFTAGDTIRFQGWQDSGVALNFGVPWTPNIAVVKIA